MNLALPILVLFAVTSSGFASGTPKFESELFERGTLVYSDDFDGELNRERWGQPKVKQVKVGKLNFDPLGKIFQFFQIVESQNNICANTGPNII